MLGDLPSSDGRIEGLIAKGILKKSVDTEYPAELGVARPYCRP